MADISLITGNLTILGSTTLSGSAYIPSGYTNTPFVPSTPVQRYLLSNGTESTLPFAPSGVYATGFKFSFIFSSDADLNRHINTQRWYILTGSTLNGRVQGDNTIQINQTGVTIPFPVPNPASFYSQAVLTNYSIDERFNHIEQSGVFALQNRQKIGFGTFNPQEKIHVSGGNLRVDNTGFFNDIYLGGQRLNINTNTVNLTGNQTIDGIKTFNVAPIVGGNPLITGNLSLYATTINLASTGSTLVNSINSLSGTLTGNYVTKSNGQFTNRPNVNGTGVLLSGEAIQIDLDTIVRTSGHQTITGIKTFVNTPQTVGGGLFATEQTAVVIFGNQYVNGLKDFYIRPKVNGTGVLLIGEVNQVDLGTTIRITGNQNVSGVKNFFSRVQVNGTGVLLSGEGIPSPIAIFNNGSSQGNASSLNFAGAGISVNTAGAQATITVTSNTQTTIIPTSSNSTGVSGSFAISDDYFYFCKRPNKWVRTALSEW
jgi:hypothetical protein